MRPAIQRTQIAVLGFRCAANVRLAQLLVRRLLIMVGHLREPLDATAPGAHVAGGRVVEPFHAEERHPRRVQQPGALVEQVMLAMRAPQRAAPGSDKRRIVHKREVSRPGIAQINLTPRL